MKGRKLIIIDGNSILNRAFYGLRGKQLLATSDGLYTNAVYGFLNILHKYIEEEKPEYLCVAFDMKAPTFRHKEFEGYKAARKGMPPELAVQVPVIKEVLDAMKIKRLEYEGFEADDIIGSISLCAEKSGMETVIVTGDRDSLQLATGSTRIKMPVTRTGKTETEEYDYDRVVEKYGVTPEQLIDVKGLMGDASDNIPGVPGIGEKTALELIKRFGSIENLYGNIDLVERAGIREKLLNNKELAFLSKKIARIERNMPHLCELGELERKEADTEKLYDLFKRLEFKSLIEKYQLSARPVRVESPTKIDCLSDPEGVIRLKNLIEAAGEVCFFHLIDSVDLFNDVLSGLAILCKGGEAVYLDFTRNLDEDFFLSEFRSVFENSNIRKYAHDVKSFMVYLKRKGIEMKGLAFDTMLAAYIINPTGDTYTIPELSEAYCNISVESIEHMAGKGKNLLLYRHMPTESISCAAAVYSQAIYRLRGVLDSILKENGQEGLYYDIELPLVEVLADMEYHGFKVDVEVIN